MRAADPSSKIIFGGLLLDRPNTPGSAVGKSEKFLEGALRAGADSSFDILAFHVYGGYYSRYTDADIQTAGIWPSDTGRMRGKAAFVREVMARYGMNKPLFANEVGLICFYCPTTLTAPPPGFVDAQADLVPRLLARAMHVGIEQVTWYTLEDADWLFSSLMGPGDEIRPAYTAYQTFIERIGNGPVAIVKIDDYGVDVEAYRFTSSIGTTDVAWTVKGNTISVHVPLSHFYGAFARDGEVLTADAKNNGVQIRVDFSPIYIVRNRFDE